MSNLEHCGGAKKSRARISFLHSEEGKIYFGWSVKSETPSYSQEIIELEAANEALIISILKEKDTFLHQSQPQNLRA